MSIALSREIAREAHHDQFDKQGRPYFEGHVEPIALSLEHLGEHAVMAGYLHDVVEDCEGYDLQVLRAVGIPEEVLRAVDSVSRRDGESYEDLIARSCADPIGVHVKLADNAHNILCSPALARIDQALAERMLKRYLAARDRLVEARVSRPWLGRTSPRSTTAGAPGRT